MSCPIKSCDVIAEHNLGVISNLIFPQMRVLALHPLYRALVSIADIKVFMEHHVFAVWDFMVLLKALQRHLTCTGPIWKPAGNAASRRLVNALVLEEESDEVEGQPTSHFEVYLAAMRQVGADVRPITNFLSAVTSVADMDEAFLHARAPFAARAFVRTTFDIIASGKPHMICAAFTFGREQAIPGIFQSVLDAMTESRTQLSTLSLYLARHIELDGEDHGPKALAMLSNLCGDDARKWREAGAAARWALDARIALWSGIATELEHDDHHVHARTPGYGLGRHSAVAANVP